MTDTRDDEEDGSLKKIFKWGSGMDCNRVHRWREPCVLRRRFERLRFLVFEDVDGIKLD